MKKLFAWCLCGLLLLTAACPVWAEETEPAETTTESVTESEATATEPTETTSVIPDIGTTTASVTETTTTAELPQMAVRILIAYEDGDIRLRVTDENGDPVPGAPLTVTIDKRVVAITAGKNGEARVTAAEQPEQILCSMSMFRGERYVYLAGAASVMLNTTEERTDLTTTTSVTETATETTTTRVTTTFGPVSTWTTGDPEQGDITATEIIPGVTTAPFDEETPAAVTTAGQSDLPKGLALGLIIFGGVLLLAAALVVYFFLSRAPRKEDGKTEEEIEGETEEEIEEEEIPQPEADTGEPEKREMTNADGVSLEDLFKNLLKEDEHDL